ncbi:uncharacterized protein KY384_001423 [Bacidia gigantensis]|uniref:uncharacterized protein n=1 Tax=Bacidia gigantensis TaxID=2732470 RepID=UPI001D04688D|nr:uncharacterized protein KY384_001423 [Bacidia gigantensis]KAG8533682.1 hypothetical protein KY384_001423 [Bacidia gigantensis]
MLMNTEEADSELPKQKKHKKHKDKSSRHSEKKRKHEEVDQIEHSSPVKKHGHRHQKRESSENDQTLTADKPDHSPFHHETSSLYVPLAPIAQSHPIQGLCAEHLSPHILTYFAPFHGTIISYSNARISSAPEEALSSGEGRKVYSQAINEYAATHVWLTADFLIFKPSKGDIIEGYINLQNESQIGLLCWNFFSASIDRKRLPKQWKWVPGSMTAGKRKRKLKRPSSDREMDIDESSQSQSHNKVPKSPESIEGYFTDGNGEKIQRLVQFRVNDVETSAGVSREVGLISVKGTMLSDEDEAELLHNERIETLGGVNRGMDAGNQPAAGRVSNAHDDMIDVDSPS